MARVLPETCRIIVIGDGGIGKTCLLHHYVKGVFLGDTQEYVRTLFENYRADVEVKLPTKPSSIAHRAIAIGRGQSNMTQSEVETIHSAHQAFESLFAPPHTAAESEPTAPNRTSETVKLDLNDTAGQEMYEGLRELLYANPDIDDEVSNVSSSGKPSRKQSGAYHGRRPMAAPPVYAKPAPVPTKPPPIVVVCFAWNNPQSLTNVETKWNRDLQKIQQSSTPTGMHLATEANNGARRPFVVVLCATKMDTMVPEGQSTETAAASPQCTWRDVLQVKERIGADVFVPCSSRTGAGVATVFQAGLLVWASRVREAVVKASSQKKQESCCTM